MRFASSSRPRSSRFSRHFAGVSIGSAGYWYFKSIFDAVKSQAEYVERQADKVTSTLKVVQTQAGLVDDHARTVDNQVKVLGRLNQAIGEAKKVVGSKLLFSGFAEALRTKGDEIGFYRTIRNLDDLELNLRVLEEVEAAIAAEPAPKERERHIELLKMIVEDARDPEEKINAYYVLLATELSVGHRNFAVDLSAFDKYLKEHKDQRVAMDFSRFENLFAREQRDKLEAFRQIKTLIPAR